jgi:hypothetical protein
LRKIRIFLASSAELDQDKKDLESFISAKNKDFYEKRIFLELTTWKDFISSVREGRTQDEYNRYINSSDISVFLFHTKLGRYTKEEFDHAHQAFLSCKRTAKTPRIYTFFKTEDREPEEIENFRLYIDKLQHFYDTYTSTEALFVNINKQFDKLENEGVIFRTGYHDTSFILKRALYFFFLPLLLLAGIMAAIYYFQPTDLTVMIIENKAIPRFPFSQGTVTLVYGDKSETLEIKEEVTFKQIPSKYKHNKLKIRFFAKGFLPVDTLVSTGSMVELAIRRDNSLSVIFGSVKDEKMRPVKDVLISVRDIQVKTDDYGKFRIEIPLSKQAIEQRLTAYKEGYQYWDFTGPPSLTDEWKIKLKN